MVDKHQFGRSATDVEDEGRPIARLEKLVAAEHGQPCFFLRWNDVEDDAGFLAHAIRELTPVLRAAAGFRRDGSRQGNVAAAQLVRANA